MRRTTGERLRNIADTRATCKRQRPRSGPAAARRLSAIPLILLALTACSSPAEAPAESARRSLAGAAAGRNVLLLTVDTLRADRLNAYGYAVRATSPNLDALLAGGVTFERASAPRAATWPSLATVLTGLYPSGHGVVENGYELPDGLPSLPLLLRSAGYRTGAFLSNMCKANHQGWDAFACTGGEDGKTIARALEWVGSAEREGDDRPWLLWVHLFGAHGPYYNGGGVAAAELDPGYEGPLGPKKWQLDRIMEEEIALDERDIAHLDALYDAAVIGSDRLAGRLLRGLRERGGLGEDAVVVLLADHGEELYDHHGYLYHACSVYETTLHVPLGILVPGLLPGGGRVRQRVELGDVLPTLLDLLGVTGPEESHGVSLVPYLDRSAGGGSGGGPGRPAFGEYGQVPLHTVAAGDWKLVWNPTGHQPYCVAGAPEGHYPLDRVELYDLAADPGETVNLAEENPARVAELSGLIERRFAGLRRRAETQEIPEALREELRALGYVAN